LHLLTPCPAVLPNMHGIFDNRPLCQNWSIRILGISSVNHYYV